MLEVTGLRGYGEHTLYAHKGIRHMYLRRILGFATLSVVLSACPSLSTLHTAKPVEVGEIEVTVAPGLYGAGLNDSSIGGGVIALPQTELQLRYGVDENMDIGIKYSNFVMFTFDFNWALINTDDFVLSVDPTFSGLMLPSTSGSVYLAYLWLPILMDVVNTDSFALTVGIKPGFITGGAGSDLGSVGSTGAMMGFSLGAKVMLTERFGLLPELSIASPFSALGQGILFNAGLGLVF